LRLLARSLVDRARTRSHRPISTSGRRYSFSAKLYLSVRDGRLLERAAGSGSDQYGGSNLFILMGASWTGRSAWLNEWPGREDQANRIIGCGGRPFPLARCVGLNGSDFFPCRVLTKISAGFHKDVRR